jgi:hypothetical protein
MSKLIFICLLLTGCGRSCESPACLSEHTEEYTYLSCIYVASGNMMVPLCHPETGHKQVCDLYETQEQFKQRMDDKYGRKYEREVR